MQAATLAFINSVLQVAQAFGISLNNQQDAAITTAINTAWVLLMVLISYNKNGTILPGE